MDGQKIMADNKEKIIRFYKGTEGEETAVRLVDLAGRAQKSGRFALTDFLSPYEQEIAETVAVNFPSLTVSFSGGYLGAERQRAMFIDKDFAEHCGELPFEIAAVKALWRSEFVRVGHRDVLGAVLGLGLERGKVGDIIATGESAKILVDEKIAEFLLGNLTEIGAASVNTELCDLSSIEPREERVKEISATVASLRVDAVAAAGFGMSRSKAAADVAADKLKLNWQRKNAAQQIKEGDMLSMRGRGRVEVTKIRGTTKKGRIGLDLKRYI